MRRDSGSERALLDSDVGRLVALVAELHDWYARCARRLPWRETSDPYAIWVSEVMLQQTQVATVVPYYERWLAQFPDIKALAAAEEGVVLRAWQGLGYYRRARGLHHAAREVVASYGGVVPSAHDTFRSLPGVGPYTAAAVLSIAYGTPLAAVDGNVKRVLARLLALSRPTDRGLGLKLVESVAQRILPANEPGMHNQAMMELGAAVCVPRRPRCAACPMQRVCKGWQSGSPETYPVRLPKKRVPHQHLAVGLVQWDHRLLIYRRPYGGMLAGLWDLPNAALGDDQSPDEAAAVLEQMLRRCFGVETKAERMLGTLRHAYTHLKVTLHAVALRAVRDPQRAAEGNERCWVLPQQLDQHALTKAGLKVLEAGGV